MLCGIKNFIIFFLQVKVITCSGSNIPLATPVAISTTLPPSVAALNQQGITMSLICYMH